MPSETIAEQKAREALAANPFPPTPWVTVTNEGIVIATGYSEALNRLLRWVPNAKWRPARRSWVIPLSGAEAVRAVLPEITRLADAAQELDEVAPAPSAAPAAAVPNNDPTIALAKAAELLHGPNWRGILEQKPSDAPVLEWIAGQRSPDPADPRLAAFIAGLRAKAEALAQAADQIEASLGAAAIEEQARSRRP
ncbi:hypothetical protein [Methylocapsa aurea]|uniref:hypothetical protein n=1 Tax=Methylocapsa aurea TaxID=663610 RepID=UPI00055A2B0A|nr:hypothetical protein [Methylocapsa aurea]